MPRPPLLNGSLRRRLLDLVRSGVGIGRAARMAGIHEDTLGRWIREKPDFAGEIEAARAESSAHLERHIAGAAESDWKAAAWLLERRHPEEYGRPALRLEARATLDFEGVLAAIEERRASASAAVPAQASTPEAEGGNPTPPPPQPTTAPRPASVALTLESVVPDEDGDD
jgi:hypothetical protein